MQNVVLVERSWIVPTQYLYAEIFNSLAYRMLCIINTVNQKKAVQEEITNL